MRWVKHATHLKKVNLQEYLPFQSQTTQSRTTVSSVRSMMSSLQSGSYFFTTLLALAITPTVPTKNCFLYFSQFFAPYFTSLLNPKTIPIIPTSTSFLFLYTLVIFYLPIFRCSYPCNFHQKSFSLLQPFSQFRLHKIYYYHYFHNLLIPTQDLTCSRKPVV